MMAFSGTLRQPLMHCDSRLLRAARYCMEALGWESAAGNFPLGYVFNTAFWQVELFCSSSHADELSAGVGSSLGRQHLWEGEEQHLGAADTKRQPGSLRAPCPNAYWWEISSRNEAGNDLSVFPRQENTAWLLLGAPQQSLWLSAGTSMNSRKAW